jgi:flagellar basal-body rod protein FlgC
MGFKDISQIAGSAMAAQTVRMNTIASNLANANAVAGTEADAYRARKPVFAAMVGDAGTASVQVLDHWPMPTAWCSTRTSTKWPKWPT